MNNDYLWDRTGEPDVEVQQLEDVLGTLRYQPQPLELPAEVQPAARRRSFSALAVAATIALLVLAAGVWIRFYRQQVSPPAIAKEGVNSNQASVTSTPTPVRPDELITGLGNQARLGITAPKRSPAPRHTNRKNILTRRDEMTATQRAEAEAAKDQIGRASCRERV